MVLRSPEGTCLHASLTPCTQLLIKKDDPIKPLRNGSHRASAHAGGFAAVHAMQSGIAHRELPSDSSGTYLEYSDPMLSGRDLMFLLTGHLAGKATNAFILVEKERGLIHF